MTTSETGYFYSSSRYSSELYRLSRTTAAAWATATGQVAKCICDGVGSLLIAVVVVIQEPLFGLLPVDDAHRNTLPGAGYLSAGRRGEHPQSGARRHQVPEVVKALDVVQDDEAIGSLSAAQKGQAALGQDLGEWSPSVLTPSCRPSSESADMTDSWEPAVIQATSGQSAASQSAAIVAATCDFPRPRIPVSTVSGSAVSMTSLCASSCSLRVTTWRARAGLLPKRMRSGGWVGGEELGIFRSSRRRSTPSRILA